MNYSINYPRRILGTTDVEVTATAVIFKLPNQAFAYTGARGVMLISITHAAPAGTTQTLPVLFEANNVTQGASVAGGESLQISALSTGVYQFYFDKTTNTLQLL